MRELAVIKLGGTTIAAGQNKEADSYVSTGKLILSKLKTARSIVVVVSAYSNATDRLLQKAKNLSTNPDRRALDLLLSCGEQETVAMLGIFLRSRGVKCALLTGWQAGIKTNGRAGKAHISSIDGARIRGILFENDVVIITGFQGVAENSDITTLGRGGSDTSAVALAVALGVPDCEIITDVDGIYTFNPNMTADAKHIPEVGYKIAMEFSSAGTSVIDSRAVELAKKNNINISISHFSSGSNLKTVVSENEVKSVAGVILNENCSLLTVENIENAPGQFSKIIDVFSSHMVRIGYFYQSFSEESSARASFMLWEHDEAVIQDIKAEIPTLLPSTKCYVSSKVLALSLVGYDIMAEPGTAFKATKILEDYNVTLHGISSSPHRLTFLVGGDAVHDAAIAMHNSFGASK
jgi:aspartate kinase